MVRSLFEDPPTCLHYSIEWSATLDEKEFVRDTETDLVLNPAAYWQQVLQRRVESLVQNKIGSGDSYKIDHIVVIVSLSGRSERKLVKYFETDIDWRCVESHLTKWSDQFQSGKKLQVDISFYYTQLEQQTADSTLKRGRKQGRSSATQRMRNQLRNQQNAEQESTGNPATWSTVYRIMRCPDACPKGPHYLIDKISGNHIKMFPYHLEEIINRKDNGMTFESQDDIPGDLRRQLLAEEQQKRDSARGKTAKSSGMTPITINNHFPDPAQFPSVPGQSGEFPVANCKPPAPESLEIPSPLDLAVLEYSDWQKSRVSDRSWKVDIDNARDIVLEQHRDLRQIHSEQDFSFLVEKDVYIGTAKRFVSDIPIWIKRRQCQVSDDAM